MKKEISLLIKHLKPFTPLITIAIVLLFIVIIVATVSEDPTKLQFAVLQEEFKQHGVRFFVDAELSPIVLLDVDTKEEFMLLIDKYQPKILYYFSSIKSFRFIFFEDEAEKQIAYRCYIDFEMWR